MPNRTTPQPPKDSDVLGKVQKAARDGSYRVSPHAEDRKKQRTITDLEIEQVFESGWHDKSKDRVENGRWRYSIRGKTLMAKESESSWCSRTRFGWSQSLI